MISQFERQLINNAQYEVDLKISVNIVSNSKNPFFLLEYAQAYNWDNGLEVVNAVADNEHCDLGIALSLFWLADAMCYLIKDIKRNEYNEEWSDFCEKMISRISTGWYKLNLIRFEPPLGRVEKYTLIKQGVPEIFINKVIPKDKTI